MKGRHPVPILDLSPLPLHMKYVPNALTIARIILTPLMLVALLSNTFWGLVVALVLFVFAAASDYLDGKIARSYKVRSRLGTFLDPLADKILVLGTFIALIFVVPDIVPWWAVALIALRDIAVTVQRMWAEAQGRSLRTLPIAKAKTGVQIGFLIAMLLLLVSARLPGAVGEVAGGLLESVLPFIVLLLVVGFTVLTGVVYLMRQEYFSSVNPS